MKNSETGITLIEVIVTVAIVALFSVILISDYPKIQKQFALSRTAYRLAQNFRRAEDLGLSGSGTQTVDAKGEQTAATGFGIYVDLAHPKQYIIYADIPDGNSAHWQKYSGSQDYENNLCLKQDSPQSDCIVEIIDVLKENPNLYIEGLENITGGSVSINFTPPRPAIDISDTTSSVVGIILGLSDDESTKTVRINTSGLIEVK